MLLFKVLRSREPSGRVGDRQNDYLSEGLFRTYKMSFGNESGAMETAQLRYDTIP